MYEAELVEHDAELVEHNARYPRYKITREVPLSHVDKRYEPSDDEPTVTQVVGDMHPDEITEKKEYFQKKIKELELIEQAIDKLKNQEDEK